MIFRRSERIFKQFDLKTVCFVWYNSWELNCFLKAHCVFAYEIGEVMYSEKMWLERSITLSLEFGFI